MTHLPARLLDRVVAAVPLVLGTLATAGLVHFGTILAFPGEIDDDVFHRIAALAPVGEKTEIPPGRRVNLPFRDAAMVAAVCRFDLAAGPFRITVPEFGQGLLSIALYDSRGRAFSGLNLHEDAGSPTILTVSMRDGTSAAQPAESGSDEARTLPIVAPGRRGFALIEAPTDAAAALKAVTCGPA